MRENYCVVSPGPRRVPSTVVLGLESDERVFVGVCVPCSAGLSVRMPPCTEHARLCPPSLDKP